MELPWPVRMAAESLSSPPDPTFSLSDDGVLHSYVRTFAGVMSESYPEGGTQRQKAPLTGDEVVSTFHWEGSVLTTAVTVVGKPDVTTHRRWVASPKGGGWAAARMVVTSDFTKRPGAPTVRYKRVYGRKVATPS